MTIADKQRVLSTHLEAYSARPVELEADDGADGVCEGCEWPAVVGVEDSPGFQVRDRLFDSPADFVDGGVELLFPVEEFAVRWFPDGRDHVEPRVAFAACPGLRSHSVT